MIYAIINVMDSCENIEGLRYRIISMEDSVREEPSIVREEPDPRIKTLEVIIAKYDTEFQHESALSDCFEFIRKHITKNQIFCYSMELRVQRLYKSTNGI